MIDCRLVVSVRRSLLYYFEKRLRLDITSSANRAQETPIVLENPIEFRRALQGDA